MPPVSASQNIGGSASPSTTSPSDETRETKESTFSDSAEKVEVRDRDRDKVVHLSVFNSMQHPDDSTPLPNGDGGDHDRGSPTPVRSRPEPHYSDEDIEILHKIVATGEEILAALPERERLPTNALFQAADEVLPKHGYESEDVPHISRLLFRIGGQRDERPLLEKFRSVLESMGIELVYTDTLLMSPVEGAEFAGGSDVSVSDQERDAQPPRRMSPRRDGSAPPAPNLEPHAHVREVSTSPSPMHYAPHRRRNSDSIAVSFVAPGNEPPNGHATPAPRLIRSQSSAAGTPEGQKKEVRFSDIVDTQSISEPTWEQNVTGLSTIQNIPFRPRPGTSTGPGQPDGLSKGLNGSAQAGLQDQHRDDDYYYDDGDDDDDDGDDGDGARPATRAENRPPPDFSRFGQQAQASGSQAVGLPNGVLSDEELSSSMDYGDEDGEYREEPSLPQHPVQPEERQGIQHSEESDENHDLRHDEYSTALPHRDAEDEGNMTDAQVAYISSREQMFRMSSFNHWAKSARRARAYNIRAESHAEQWDALETMGEALSIWIETALTMHIDESEGIRAYQEHARARESLERGKESAERSSESIGPVAAIVSSEGSGHARVRQSIERSRESAIPVPRAGPDRRAPASQIRQTSLSVEGTLIEDLPHRPRPRSERRTPDPQAERLQSFGGDWDQNVGRAIPHDDFYYDASEEPEEEDLVSDTVIHSRYQLAAAAWDYFLLSKAFTHWANRAEEEVQRTQVARRHILRKKCFSAWIDVEEKDETEAESKAVWFSQLVAMKQWRDEAVVAKAKNRRIHELAERRERHDAAEEALTAWYHESKMRLAAAIDTRRLQTACYQHWQAEGRWLDSAHEEAEGIFRGSMLGRYMRHWKVEARVQERAEEGAGPIIARRDEFLRSGLTLAWRHEAEEFKGRERVAILRELGGIAKHWLYETRIRAWQELQDAELVDITTYHWYCEWRLILCKRVMEQQDRARFFEKWTAAATQSSVRSYRLRNLARDVRYHDSITGFFNASVDALEQLEEQSVHARALILSRVVPKTVRKWTAQTEHHHRLQNWSRLGRFFAAGEHALLHWQQIRKQEWKARMMRLYGDFRYRVHRDTTRDCLDAWRKRTADVVASGWEAEDMCVEDETALVVDVAEEWRAKLEYVAFSREVAEDADKEVHLMLWHSLLEVQEESRLDAAEWDFGKTASEYWEGWELASVSLRGRDRAVQEFMGHNARRDRRHFYAVWASQTSTAGDRVPELGTMMDFRATRRSSRWNTPAPARSRMLVDYTPFRTPLRPNFRLSTTGMTTTPAYRPPSEMTFEEGDEAEMED